MVESKTTMNLRSSRATSHLTMWFTSAVVGVSTTCSTVGLDNRGILAGGILLENRANKIRNEKKMEKIAALISKYSLGIGTEQRF